jgi:hypothetical protein
MKLDDEEREILAGKQGLVPQQAVAAFGDGR